MDQAFLLHEELRAAAPWVSPQWPKAQLTAAKRTVFFPHVWVAVPMMFQRDGTGTVFGLGVHLICKYYCLDLFCSDRLVPELDTIVPVESTKAYDMLDIIHAVSLPV